MKNSSCVDKATGIDNIPASAVFRTSAAGAVTLSILSCLIFSLLFGVENIHAEGSTIRMVIDNPSLTLDLMPKSGDGVFAESNDMNIDVSTDGGKGYTLSISAKESAKLAYGDYYLSSIEAAVSESQFSATGNTQYNDKWGYKPSKRAINNVATENHSYLPAPSTRGEILDITNSANAAANRYTISIGARANLFTPPGSYSGVFIISAIANLQEYTQNTYARYEDENGNYGGYTLVDSKSVLEGDEYSYTKAADVVYQEASIDAYVVAAERNNYIDIPRNIYSVYLYPGTHTASVSGAGSYRYGSSVTVSATADYGYAVTSWSGVHFANPFTFTIAGDVALRAIDTLETFNDVCPSTKIGQTCAISGSSFVRLADGRLWSINNMGSVAIANAASYCPANTIIPSIYNYDELLATYGGYQVSGAHRAGVQAMGIGLNTLKGLTNWYNNNVAWYWSSTPWSTSSTFLLGVGAGDAITTFDGLNTNIGNTLCVAYRYDDICPETEIGQTCSASNATFVRLADGHLYTRESMGKTNNINVAKSYCPSGSSIPTSAEYDDLLIAYRSTTATSSAYRPSGIQLFDPGLQSIKDSTSWYDNTTMWYWSQTADAANRYFNLGIGASDATDVYWANNNSTAMNVICRI